jgi:hypothetical protein
MTSGIPYQCGLSVHGYKNFLTKHFSFNATAIDIGNTKLTVFVATEDSSYFSSLRLSYIVTGLTAITAPSL